MEAKIISTSFCIYGAGIVATSIYKAIQTIYGRVPVFFLVSDTTARQGINENPRVLERTAIMISTKPALYFAVPSSIIYKQLRNEKG